MRVLTLALLLAGCAVRSSPPWIVAGAQPVAAAEQAAAERLFGPAESWTGHVTIAVAQRPAIPHAGLQLPRVSPDGRWIATLQPIAPDAAGYDPSSLIDGNGLAAVRLVVRAVDGEADEHVVATPGPCWPVWINRHELLFVSYDERGTCALAVYDVRTRRTQRKSLGLRHMVAPAPHRDGRRVAVSGWGNVPDESVIFLADLDNLRLDPGPPVTPGRGAQIFPRWIGDDTLLYVELGEDHARLMRWKIGDRQAHEVATLAAPPTVHDAHHILGGVYDPVSPRLQHYAAYLPAYDAIVLTRLDTGETAVARRGTRAGTWWNDQWFIASRDDAVELIHVAGNAPQHNTLTLLRTQAAPVWADPAARSLLLVGPGDDPAQLNVLQLWLVLEE